jgi:lipid-A-disaccharide synthase
MGASIAGPIFLCAGEPSGDLYAALYVQEVRKSFPTSRFYGVGGPQMCAAGVDIVYPSNELETLGFQSVLGSLPRHINALHRIKKALQVIKPKTFIAVAYPGMNLLLIQYARHMGCVVHYLLPPQAWAWGAFRADLVERWVDTVVSVFPFEYEYYKHRRVHVQCWDNPLQSYLRHYVRTDKTRRIGFMPGSRRQEIRRNLPVIASYYAYLCTRTVATRFALILHDQEVVIKDPWIRRVVQDLEQKYRDRLVVHTEDRYAAMKNCDLLVTCSGTASLEAAFMDIPQVFFNRCSWFDYTLMRRFVAVKEYNLTNLYYGRTVVPSCVSSSDRRIATFLQNIDVRAYIN